ncbi:MAG TPA: L,D-transpeptidase family protein [Ignavibacteria bacterium]|nr:L,D-transpeptidase family protein [Ignavibacteria bacterium]
MLIAAGSVYYFCVLPSKTNIVRSMLPSGSVSDSIVVFKSERKLLLYYRGKYLKTYSISLGDSPIGHKEKEGDEKTPEGLYSISGRNPNSKYHLSLRISYPNEQDKLNAEKNGYSPGGDIMIHGLPNSTGFLEDYYVNNDWTDGCIAVTNDEIEEIWGAVKDRTPIYINK